MNPTHTPSHPPTPGQAPPPTTTTTVQTETSPEIPAHLFDILPSLHEILSRLQPTSSSHLALPGSTPNSQTSPSKPPHGLTMNPTSTPTPGAISTSNIGAAGGVGGQGQGLPDDAPIPLHALPTAAIPLKLRLQRAKALVASLPDVERSVREQEEEIRELEERVRVLRGMRFD
ncbi:hypothetical protein K402DRAFT_419512 [Aulographum hederae CBS 113979]|uniref:Mediator of RNA polymerase II transcription subunit 9 n=1 Tax=Aulographum hederae CBS 113979 TaxID=1176131 RepID=A0A6G1H4K1_9PEZI|nr:hypothetical protein K402DRAFT_419512 [Aulographum hederae CBS 113979]